MPSIDRIGAREVDPVVGSGQRLREPILSFLESVPGLLKQGVASFQALMDLLDGVELTQAVLNGVGQVTVLPRQPGRPGAGPAGECRSAG